MSVTKVDKYTLWVRSSLKSAVPQTPHILGGRAQKVDEDKGTGQPQALKYLLLGLQLWPETQQEVSTRLLPAESRRVLCTFWKKPKQQGGARRYKVRRTWRRVPPTVTRTAGAHRPDGRQDADKRELTEKGEPKLGHKPLRWANQAFLPVLPPPSVEIPQRYLAFLICCVTQSKRLALSVHFPHLPNKDGNTIYHLR